jgi:hypothetical protein
VNDLMITFFKELITSKFFEQHPELRAGGEYFHLSGDLVHTHTYDHPHSLDEDGNNDCPYCLKRTYNKDTKKEKTNYLHCMLVFSFVFFGNLKIPIYRFPIHSKQVIDLESASINDHKQECELVGLKRVLPILKKAFPKMKIIMLLDGLYANRPTIIELNKYGFQYAIVRQEESFKTIRSDCNNLLDTENHKKNCRKKISYTNTEGWLVVEEYAWFNNIGLEGALTTNVLRIQETRTKESQKPVKYKNEWLISRRISPSTCRAFAQQARLRWEEEDLFNTLKNRGFKLKHDYSRSPSSFHIWQGLMLFSFAIFELFYFSQHVQKRCGELSRIALADKLIALLQCSQHDKIFPDGFKSIKIQFRYNFEIKKHIEQPLRCIWSLSNKKLKEKDKVPIAA